MFTNSPQQTTPLSVTYLDQQQVIPVSVAEVSRALGISDQTVRNHIRSGRLPARRVGRLLKIDPRDLELIAPRVEVSEGTP